MHQAGDQPLAGTGFALNEDCGEAPSRGLALEQVTQFLPNGVDGWALAEQFGQRG